MGTKIVSNRCGEENTQKVHHGRPYQKGVLTLNEDRIGGNVQILLLLSAFPVDKDNFPRLH